jgi:hypothetical protein
MKTLRTILVAGAFGVGLVACGDATRAVAPEAPRFDGGFTVGGGHRAMSSDTSTTAAPSSAETTAGDGFAERGGFTVGGGH